MRFGQGEIDLCEARYARASTTACALLRGHSVGVLSGSLGFVALDIAVLGACFEASGDSPTIGLLVPGYLIGQLGGNIPIPDGTGGADARLIRTFALYQELLAITTTAVLAYPAIALWIPGAARKGHVPTTSASAFSGRHSRSRRACPVPSAVKLRTPRHSRGDSIWLAEPPRMAIR